MSDSLQSRSGQAGGPSEARKLLRSLPSVSALLEAAEVKDRLHGLPRATVVSSLRVALDGLRREILAGETSNGTDLEEILGRAEHEIFHRSTPSLRRVINATGVVLHTGLGRAPLSEAAIEAIVEGASGYCNLEYDLETGGRGRRVAHVNGILASLCGAAAATVVNNNAAATLLILHVLAAAREVVVSRGQLIEIGGSFRLPEIMTAGGAVLREVGTTNRTRLTDYERAIGESTAILMRVHPSNYRITGFVEDVPIGELARLARERGLIAVDDLGSGALVDFAAHGLPPEPSVRNSIAAGADLVCFSGDKLLGGPQCGIIVGQQELIGRIEAHPLMRTYRVDKLTLLALEATARAYAGLDDALAAIPALSMLTASTEVLAGRAGRLAEMLQKALPDQHFFVCSDSTYAGGGSMPDVPLETVVVQWRPAGATARATAAALREAETPVIARIRDEAICFDVRTIRDADLETLVSSVTSARWETQEAAHDAEP